MANYRAITGISAPSRSKQYPYQKPDNIIAPWKMQKRNRIMSKQAQQIVDQRSFNMSSRLKNNLPTKATGNESKSSSSNKQKVKIPKITNREGLRSQPAKQITNEDQKMISRNNTKPNPNTAGNGFKFYQTPSFLSPNGSRITEKAPSVNSQTTYSKTSTMQEFNNDSSMVEKHTIIFESDLENSENHSQAPTESQHLQHKQTIYLDDGSSLVEGGTPINNSTMRRDSSKVDSEKPPIFNNPNSGKNLATFRGNKQNSQSDIYYNDVNLDEYYEDPRVSKTALYHTRQEANQSKITVGRVEASKDQPDFGNSTPKVANMPKFADANIQTQLDKLDLSPSEKQKLNDEIYLNTNSAEENPDYIDDNIEDSVSVSKHTLWVNTHTEETDEEGESGMSIKENVPKFDKNLQISPNGAPFIDKGFQIGSEEAPYQNKNMQTSTKNAPQIANKTIKRNTVFTRQSEYIDKKKNKLEGDNNRREKFKSVKNVVEYQSQNNKSKVDLLAFRTGLKAEI